MTTRSAFSPQDWTTVTEGPPTADMIVITAAHGGMIRETVAIAKAYTDARAEHGDSELLNEIVAAKPKMEHTRFRSPTSSRSMGWPSCATRWPWSGTRPPPGNWMTTGASCSPWPARSRPRTGSTGSA